MKITKGKIALAFLIFSSLVLLLLAIGAVMVSNIPGNGISVFSSLLVRNETVIFLNVDVPNLIYGRFRGALSVNRSVLQISSTQEIACPPSVEFFIDNEANRHAIITMGPPEFAARLAYCLENRSKNCFVAICREGYPQLIGVGPKLSEKLDE